MLREILISRVNLITYKGYNSYTNRPKFIHLSAYVCITFKPPYSSSMSEDMNTNNVNLENPMSSINHTYYPRQICPLYTRIIIIFPFYPCLRVKIHNNN